VVDFKAAQVVDADDNGLLRAHGVVDVAGDGKGAHRLRVWAKDRAGNVSRRATLSFTVR